MASATYTTVQGTFTDDSVDEIVSRVVARIRAKGLAVQGVYTEGWANASRPDVWRVRSWFIAVVEADESNEMAVLEAEVLGEVVIHEQVFKTIRKVRGIADANCQRSTQTRYKIGYDNAVIRARLGWVD